VETIILLSLVLGYFSCFLLLWFRGARMERHLTELSRSVARLHQRPGGDPAVEALLQSIHELDKRIESHLGALLALQSKSQLGEARDVVERKLHLQGYEDVRLTVEEEGRVRDNEPVTRFGVLVTRRGVEYRGYAVVRAGVIVDSRLNPVYATFP